jgi:type VI protein secretion system component VasA
MYSSPHIQKKLKLKGDESGPYVERMGEVVKLLLAKREDKVSLEISRYKRKSTG